MSGGSMNYAYSYIKEFAKELCDKEMSDLALDMSKVFKSAEWWHSCDSSEEKYRKDVKEFKEKWFTNTRTNRLKSYVDEIFDNAKKECLNLIGD